MPRHHAFARVLGLTLLTLTALSGCAGLDRRAPLSRDARMAWWREARFGMFIHWGLYALPAGQWQGRDIPSLGEWIMANAAISRADYEPLAARFNPTEFDAAAWVALAKDAGMKYLVITSKHHDGFCLFDSAVTEYDVMDATPFKRDIIGKLATECRRQGIVFGVYYSILDWHHPAQYVDAEELAAAQGPSGPYSRNHIHPERKQEYLDYMRAQLRELITRYDVAVLWFDGEWVEWWTEADGQALYDELLRLKPDLVVNNRIGKQRYSQQDGANAIDRNDTHAGDFGTPEQHIPPTGLPGVDWESCMTINDTWGFKRTDHNWKDTATLIRQLVDIASKGGNMLLNVGPTAQGVIPQPSVDRLTALGHWMDRYGSAIYGTQASPFAEPLPWGRVTSKPDRLFLHVFDWPADGRLTLPVTPRPIRRAYLLDDPTRQPLPLTAGPAAVTLIVPATAPDPYVSVIAAEY